MIPFWGPTPKQVRSVQEAERQMRYAKEQRAASNLARPVLRGFDLGAAAGDYSVEVVVRVNADGSVSLVSMRAETRAQRPDPGTDTTDNDLQRPRSGP